MTTSPLSIQIVTPENRLIQLLRSWTLERKKETNLLFLWRHTNPILRPWFPSSVTKNLWRVAEGKGDWAALLSLPPSPVQPRQFHLCWHCMMFQHCNFGAIFHMEKEFRCLKKNFKEMVNRYFRADTGLLFLTDSKEKGFLFGKGFESSVRFIWVTPLTGEYKSQVSLWREEAGFFTPFHGCPVEFS